MKKPRSSSKATLAESIGCQKEGQPVPESNLVFESKNGEPQQAQRYIPESWQFQYSPVKADSVPFSRHTWYCCGVSRVFHSCSDLTIFSAIIIFHSKQEYLI